jgi:L-lactate dehydrogenase complex protein LldG
MAQGQSENSLLTASRDAILQAIRAGRGSARLASAYALPLPKEDPLERFTAKARASIAEVYRIASREDAPEAILALLSAGKAPPRLHIPVQSALSDLPWHRAPGLMRSGEPPSGEDAAFSTADYGIAETGTLVFFSGAKSLSSWHFRPGREIVLLERVLILPRLEDVITRLSVMPATLNLVTGPSRTADIEQTIELGAHGPREIHILIIG